VVFTKSKNTVDTKFELNLILIERKAST